MKIKTPGLLPTPHDQRDFKLGDITVLPALSELPSSFRLDGIEIKNQGNTDFCSQFMACGMSGLQEGVSLSPEWAFAVSKELSGDPDSFGQDLRVAMSVHTKYGAVEVTECPYSISNRDSSFLRYIKNYPALFPKAIKHLKQSYVKVTGPYDHYDNIRATIWKYREEKRTVGFGVRFGWDTEDVNLDTVPLDGGGHAMYFAGWKRGRMVAVQSYGTRAGDKGIQYMSRENVNKAVSEYGAYMFIDMTPEQIKYMIENGITDRDSFLIQLMKRAVTLMQQLVAQLLAKKK